MCCARAFRAEPIGGILAGWRAEPIGRRDGGHLAVAVGGGGSGRGSGCVWEPRRQRRGRVQRTRVARRRHPAGDVNGRRRAGAAERAARGGCAESAARERAHDRREQRVAEQRSARVQPERRGAHLCDTDRLSDARRRPPPRPPTDYPCSCT